MSRTLMKNYYTLLKIRRTWMFLTGADVHDNVLVVPLMAISLNFKIYKIYVMFEGVKNPLEEG